MTRADARTSVFRRRARFAVGSEISTLARLAGNRGVKSIVASARIRCVALAVSEAYIAAGAQITVWLALACAWVWCVACHAHVVGLAAVPAVGAGRGIAIAVLALISRGC